MLHARPLFVFVSSLSARCTRRSWDGWGAGTALALAAILVLVGSGCGTAAQPGTVSSSAGVPTTVGTTVSENLSTSTVVPAVLPPSGWSSPGASVVRALAAARADAGGLKLYAPTLLPGETVAPDTWWPVSQVDSPAAYEGPPAPNPRIASSPGTLPEIRLVLRSGRGWLEIVENVRGDLGDVTGSPVGMVSGHPATLYQLGGCLCVQWADAGIWYAVVARGWPEDEVRAVALNVRPLEGS
jgi:hypothetical protein